MNKALYIGTTHDDQRGSGIGLGYSYFEDGSFDIGVIIGKTYYSIVFTWGEALRLEREHVEPEWDV